MALMGSGVRESFFLNFAYLHIGKQSEMTKNQTTLQIHTCSTK